MDPCGSAKELSKSIWLKSLVIGKSVQCFVSAVCVLYLLFKKATRWIPHPNAKVLYLNHLLWSILVPLAFGSCYGFDSVRLSIFHENPCDYTLTTGFILKTRLIPVTCLNIQSTTMLAFAIERVYSTLYPLNYEAIKSPRLGVLMIILSIVGVVAFECSTMFINVDWEQPLALYSIKTRTNAYYYQLSLYTFAAIELAAILLFSLALWKNHRMYKQYKVASVNSLRIKYQFFPVFDVVSFGIWLETASQSNLYSLVMPVILIYTLKKQEQRTVVDTTPQIDTYFAQFQKYLNPPNR